MSKLDEASARFLEALPLQGPAFELFPGHDPTSVEFLHTKTGQEVWALGEDSFNWPHVRFIKQTVPPYPDVDTRFRTVFIAELEWIWSVETESPVSFGRNPAQGVAFVDSLLARGGLIIVTRAHKVVAELFWKRLSERSKYSFDYDTTASVAVLAKL